MKNDILNEEFRYGKKILEIAQDLFEKSIYDPETKMYDFPMSSGRGYIRGSFFDLKYNRYGMECNTHELKRYEWTYLYEGLIKSASIDFVAMKLSLFEECNLIFDIGLEGMSNFNKNKTPFISFFIKKEIYDEIKNNKNSELSIRYKELNMLINNLGYFKANERIISYNGSECVYIAIHPKFIIEVTDYIYDENNGFNGILYHLTSENNWKKIQKTGLIPKNSKAFVDDYPDRVYMFANVPPDIFRQNIINFMSFKRNAVISDLKKYFELYKEGKISIETLRYKYNHRYDYTKWVVLKINLKEKSSYDKYDTTTQYRFFDDPKSSGIFTYENIDPRCISLYKKITIEETNKDIDNAIPENIL